MAVIIMSKQMTGPIPDADLIQLYTRPQWYLRDACQSALVWCNWVLLEPVFFRTRPSTLFKFTFIISPLFGVKPPLNGFQETRHLSHFGGGGGGGRVGQLTSKYRGGGRRTMHGSTTVAGWSGLIIIKNNQDFHGDQWRGAYEEREGRAATFYFSY